MRAWKALLDIRCGIDSGIPACCILWFIGSWRFLWVSKSDHVQRVRVWYLRTMRQDREFEHIPCPLCLLRDRPVAVRKTPFPNDLLTDVLIWLDSV